MSCDEHTYGDSGFCVHCGHAGPDADTEANRGIQTPIGFAPLHAVDLFCCAGGSAVGLNRAGFQIIDGYDIEPQKNYPYRFHLGNALDADLSRADFVWASPPCQAHTPLKHRTGLEYECFIERTRAKLKAWGGPYIIENVPGAPLVNPVVLCGGMFPPLRVYRHRLFESNLTLVAPDHPKHVVPCAPQRQRKAAFAAGQFVTVTGDIGRYAGEAMGINWMTGDEMSQAIPPAYAEYLGRQVVAHIQQQRQAA